LRDRLSQKQLANVVSVSERLVNSAAKVLGANAAELVAGIDGGSMAINAPVNALPWQDRALWDLAAKGKQEYRKAAATFRARREAERDADKTRRTTRVEQISSYRSQIERVAAAVDALHAEIQRLTHADLRGTKAVSSRTDELEEIGDKLREFVRRVQRIR